LPDETVLPVVAVVVVAAAAVAAAVVVVVAAEIDLAAAEPHCLGPVVVQDSAPKLMLKNGFQKGIIKLTDAKGRHASKRNPGGAPTLRKRSFKRNFAKMGHKTGGRRRTTTIQLVAGCSKQVYHQSLFCFLLTCWIWLDCNLASHTTSTSGLKCIPICLGFERKHLQ
jgi:hypothetical protein